MLRLLPFALGYAYSYLLRSAGAPLAAPMAQDLGLSSGALGVLNALFFLAFAGAQVPMGYLLERWGPSRTLGALLALAALGCGLVAAAPGLGLLALGRLAMGAGVALALVGALRAYQLLAPGRLGFLSGLTVALGGLGGLLSTWPLVRLGEAWGWRGVYGALGLLALGLALWVRGIPTGGRPRGAGGGRGLAPGAFLPLALVSGVYVGGFFALQSFWVGAYAYAQGLAGDEVGGLLALLNLASVLGAFASGGLAAAWGTGRALAVGVGVFALGLLAWGMRADLALAYALLGLGGGFNGLVLAHTAGLFREASSRAMAWVNLVGVLGIFSLQAGMGLVVEALGYGAALLGLGLLQVLALAVLWRAASRPLP
ncbi:MFS transporter (plasmid) [Thermus thermophilus]|uniref:MFS transporter n=1 Tax=Thermus thermophilus TaxID=274 RepID=UPI00324F573F